MDTRFKTIITLFAVAGVAWAGPAPALAAAPPEWRADWADGACSVKHATASGPEMKLSITPGNGLSSFTLRGEGIDRLSTHQSDRGELWLEPGGSVTATANYLSSEYPEGPALSFLSEDRAFFEKVARSTNIVVRNGRKTLFEMAFPDAQAAVAALRECEGTGLRLHGIDPDAWHALSSVPRLTVPMIKLVRWQDYPKDAVAAGASGSVIVRLSVDRLGKPVKCDWIARSGTESLDQVTCRILLKRARFHPATDAAGAPVAAPFVTRMSWRTG